MRLISPNGLWFLTLIPIFVLMYILKQRYEETQISSLYLWQQVVMDLDATSPFQRLKRNLLFFLQLLVLLLCIFALANPFIWWKNDNYQNVVMVVDASGSMSALGEKDNKLEEAKRKAEDLINSLSAGTKMTLISAAKSIKVEVSSSTDKKEVLNRLKGIALTNSAGRLEDTFSLVKAISDQYQSCRTVYFTDQSPDLKELDGEVVELGPQRPNVSLDYIAASRGDQQLKVMLRVTNHGTAATEAELCLYGEEKLISIKNEALKAGETKTVYFDNVPADSKYIYGELSKEDGLLEDNRVYTVIRQKETKRVLLSTGQNVFLEKALNTLKDIELFKTLPDEKIEEGFDLYIFDGEYAGDLPSKGNILFLDPQKSNGFFKTGEQLIGGKAVITPHSVTKYMNNSDFVISKISSLEMPYWASPLITVGDREAAFAGEFKGQKIAALGFDIHNSDFPLTLEFPIFVNNLISYLIDRDTMAATQYVCGQEIDITPLPEAEKIYVETPDGQSTELGSEYPVKPFERTNLSGIYNISQTVEEKKIEKLIAVNFPVSESGLYNNADYENSGEDIRPAGATAGNTARGSGQESNGAVQRGGINLLNLLLAAALILAIAEWAAYVRQYRV